MSYYITELPDEMSFNNLRIYIWSNIELYQYKKSLICTSVWCYTLTYSAVNFTFKNERIPIHFCLRGSLVVEFMIIYQTTRNELYLN